MVYTSGLRLPLRSYGYLSVHTAIPGALPHKSSRLSPSSSFHPASPLFLSYNPPKMNILIWNCRGLGKPVAKKALTTLISQHHPSIVFLCETKSNSRKMTLLKTRLGFQGGIFYDSNGKSGGLALFWTDDVNLTLHNFSPGYIDAEVEQLGRQPWRFTGFYGNPDSTKRHESWSQLRNLNSSPNRPWLVAGDFNKILLSSEKKGTRDRPYAAMQAFREALLDCELFDLGFKGNTFTWRNRRDDPTVQERLDRAVATVEWKLLFPTPPA